MEIKNVMSDDFSVQKGLTHPKTRSNFENSNNHTMDILRDILRIRFEDPEIT